VAKDIVVGSVHKKSPACKDTKYSTTTAEGRRCKTEPDPTPDAFCSPHLSIRGLQEMRDFDAYRNVA
jgi:hypothetical protein